MTAAAGGTGIFACQLAKIAGHYVIGTCSSDEKAEFLRNVIGVDRAINYRKENLDKVLKREFKNGIDIVYESVGGETFETCCSHLAVKGRLIVIGMIAGYVDGSSWNSSASQFGGASLSSILLQKSASVRGFFLNHFRASSLRHTQKLVDLVSAGKLSSIVDPQPFYGLESIHSAVQYMYSGKNIGKVVVTITPPSHTSKL